MANCRIKNGKYLAPNEEPSLLYQGLENKFGAEIANDLFVLSETPDFKQEVVSPILNKYKKQLLENINKFSATISKFEIVKGKKEIDLSKDLEIQKTKIGSDIAYKISAKDSLLGIIWVTPFKDGYKQKNLHVIKAGIYSEGTLTDLKNISFENELFKIVAKDLVKNNIPFYSEKIEQPIMKEFDKNGEIKEKYILEYNASLNESKEPLSFEGQQEARNVMLSVGFIQDTDSLYTALNKAFFKDGVFSPTTQSLRNSGVYTQAEIDNILSDLELQGKIKEYIGKLKYTPNIENVQIETPKAFMDYLPEVNSFGKLLIKNPTLVEKEVLNSLYNLDEVESASFQENRESVDLKDYRKVTEKEIIDGELVDKHEKLIYENAVKEVDDVSILDDIETVLNRPVEIADTPATLNFLGKISQRLKKYGINIDLVVNRSILPQLQAFLVNPNKANTRVLNDAYKSVENLKQQIVKKDKNLPLIYLDTNLSEQEVFDKFSLVKVDNNIYQKVQKINVEDLQAFLGVENMEELDMYKMYLKVPKNIVKEQKDVNTNFEGDYEYLTNDFVADFNAQRLTEADKYPDFYNNFVVNEKGIEIVNQDPYSMQTIKEYLDSGLIKNAENLKQYSLISKQMPNLIEQSTVDTKITERLNALNNSESLPKPKGNYMYINDSTMVLKSDDATFLKTEDGIFEKVQKYGDLNFYKRMDETTDDSYLDLRQQPQLLDINPFEFNYLETKFDDISQVKKHYTKEELKKINEQNFECSI